MIKSTPQYTLQTYAMLRHGIFSELQALTMVVLLRI
jgi:hypothetical protein